MLNRLSSAGRQLSFDIEDCGPAYIESFPPQSLISHRDFPTASLDFLAEIVQTWRQWSLPHSCY